VRSPFALAEAVPLDPAKFRDPLRTARGELRARVSLTELRTLWINTGTLCNLACRTCYIESSPRNDALVYPTLSEVESYLNEAQALGTDEIGFTGGEPFMNPDAVAMIGAALSRGFDVLVLTNAMRPMRRHEAELVPLREQYGARLTLRVSLDHYTQRFHEAERGPNTWSKALDGCRWLAEQGFRLAIAGRAVAKESEAAARAGYAALFAANRLPVDAFDPAALALFPEMDASNDVPEISEGCWDLLGVSPRSVMCASSRMVVKRKGSLRPHVVACTLLPYDERFALGETLTDATGAVSLNHPHCARFCVLGGASCSA
jgi:uncharacterized Fe-S cluster-containing radical SAM superfamily protein